MEDRINQLISEENADRERADTFADRADAYYRRRPRLISLLHDLYNDYVSLADRYTRALTKLNTHRHPSPSPPPSSFDDAASFSDAESTLSFQLTKSIKSVSSSSAAHGGAGVETRLAEIKKSSGGDGVDAVAELVVRNVEYEFLKNEMEEMARDSGRKIELQRSLVEVLESERLVLLGENSRLVYRSEILAEERNGAVSENAFLRTRASQLAKCVMRLEEERRGVNLGRQIDDLQRQINALEKKRKIDGVEKCCCNVGVNAPPRTAEKVVGRSGGKWSGWWKRFRKIGSGPCGLCMSVGHLVNESK